jgi:hypothetical protein
MKTREWYSGVFAGDHQGSVACQDTGKTIALSYDPADAPLLAAAPELLAALQSLAAWVEEPALDEAGEEGKQNRLGIAKAAIAKATATSTKDERPA